MDVVDWLRALDLGQYEEAFRENLVSMDLLPSLTADDLKELGVNTVGDRRRLLNAISTLRAGTEQNSVRPTPSILDGDWPHTAERRQLSVMFCDISGSTALSTRLDPEDLSAVVRAYQSTVRATIARFGGFIARYVGDGVLIYFGWPEAHETDAESAVRAALAVIAAISQSPVHGEKLSIRVGIATGLVVVGAPIGEGDARQQTAIGETPNLAARLQGLARPNNLVIADSTRIQVGSLFDLEDLGARPLAGFAEPQRAWRVIGESSAASRFEALRSDTTPLIGRDEEFELLLRRWQQAKAGDGRVALISGEPGIGKSRLTAALSDDIRGQPHRRLRWFCSPHHQDSSLYPTIAQLERAAGFARDDSPEAKLAKARDLLSPGGPGDDDFELLAELLSLPNAAADLNLSPKLKRERLFEALLRQLSELVKTDPVLAIFEDAHWIDPTSRELLDLMVERVRAIARPADDHVSPRVSAAMGRPTACDQSGAQPAGRARRRRLGQRDRRQSAAGHRGRRGDRGKDRRRPAVRRGTDQGGARARSGRPAWRQCCRPVQCLAWRCPRLARLTRRPARPDWRCGTGSRANRCGAWARLQL